MKSILAIVCLLMTATAHANLLTDTQNVLQDTSVEAVFSADPDGVIVIAYDLPEEQVTQLTYTFSTPVLNAAPVTLIIDVPADRPCHFDWVKINMNGTQVAGDATARLIGSFTGLAYEGTIIADVKPEDTILPRNEHGFIENPVHWMPGFVNYLHILVAKSNALVVTP